MLLGRLLTLGAVVLFAGQISQQRHDPVILPAVNEQGFMVISFWLCVVLLGAALAIFPVMLLGPLLEVFS